MDEQCFSQNFFFLKLTDDSQETGTLNVKLHNSGVLRTLIRPFGIRLNKYFCYRILLGRRPAPGLITAKFRNDLQHCLCRRKSQPWKLKKSFGIAALEIKSRSFAIHYRGVGGWYGHPTMMSSRWFGELLSLSECPTPSTCVRVRLWYAGIRNRLDSGVYAPLPRY